MRSQIVALGISVATFLTVAIEPAQAQWARQRQFQPNFTRPQFQPYRAPNMSRQMLPMTYGRPQRSTTVYYRDVAPRVYRAQQNLPTRGQVIGGAYKAYSYGKTAVNTHKCISSLGAPEIAAVACGSAYYSVVAGPKIVNPYIKSRYQQFKGAVPQLPRSIQNGWNVRRPNGGWIWGALLGL